MFNEYMFDENFLLELDKDNEKEVSVKIIALSKNETPIETIEGRATGGSINVDGSSAVRRTCSLSLVAQDVNINDYYWGLKNKFKLEIGLKNKINPKYPDIIWFKMGTYVITSFNTSQTVNSYTINISGKDKMCLLNGDMSGSLPHSTDFGILEEEQADGSIKYIPLTIKEIIYKAVQELGGEFPHNIIINDLDDSGLDLLEYRGDIPIYFFKNENQNIVSNMSIKPEQSCYVYNENNKEWEQKKLEELNVYNFIFENASSLKDSIETDKIEPTKVKLKKDSNNLYTIIKNTYGAISGYREANLVFAGTLIGDVGQSITSILDKIVNMLGNFEYFYDLDGRFNFRKKPYTISTVWSQLETNKNKDNASYLKPVYNFVNNKLISSFSNNPNLLNIKNDFSVWGTLKSTTGSELPIHARYAIDAKPKQYQTMRWKKIKENFLNKKIQERTKEKEEEKLEEEEIQKIKDIIDILEKLFLKEIEEEDISFEDKKLVDKYKEDFYKIYLQNKDFLYTSNSYDWRELIYQMALDYNLCNQNDDYYFNLVKNNNQYYTGKTGYEQYYIDLLGFWRELYNPYPNMEFDITKIDTRKYEQTDVKNYFRPCTLEDFQGADFLDNLYVHKEYIEKLNDCKNQDLDSVTFVPFNDFCQLTKKIFKTTSSNNKIELVFTDDDALYYYFTDEGKMNSGTKDETALNKINIKNLFVNQNELDKEVTKIIYKFFGVLTKESLKDPDNMYVPILTDIQPQRTFLTSRHYEKKVIKINDEKNSILKLKGNQLFRCAPVLIESKKIKVELTQEEIAQGETQKKILQVQKEGKKIFVPKQDDEKNKENTIIWQNKIRYVWKFFLFLKKYEELQRGFQTEPPSDFIYKTFYIKEKDKQKKIEDLDEIVQQLYKDKKEFSWIKTNNWGRPVDAQGKEIQDQSEIEKKAVKKKEKINYLYGYYKFNRDSESGNYWATQVTDSPENLLFWFDFLDAEQSEIGKFSVPMIGTRSRSMKDDDVKVICYKDIPNVIFKDPKTINNFDVKTGYIYINLQDNMQNLFTVSSKGKSAKERIDELLYEHTGCAETINVNAIPVYYLEPNQKIMVKDDESKINGEYIIDKLAYSLNYNGMMTINATKVYNNLF